MALTKKLASIADAIRGKTGKTDPLTLDQMAAEIAGIQVGQGDNMDDMLLTGTLSGPYQNARIESLVEYAFAGCSGLTEISIPNVKTVGQRAFNGCSGLTEIILPEATSIGTYFVNGCSGLRKVVLPKQTRITTEQFRGASNNGQLIVDLHSATYFEKAPFKSSNVGVLILRANTVVTCQTNVDDGYSPLTNGNGLGGYIFVRKVLVEDYKNATNWSAFAEKIRAIEGSEYE